MATLDEANLSVPMMKLELVPLPVTDVDRAKAFYQKVGFILEVDTLPSEGMRVVQFTPPGSACSIVFGTGMGEITDMAPGSVKGLHLVVDNLDCSTFSTDKSRHSSRRNLRNQWCKVFRFQRPRWKYVAVTGISARDETARSELL